VENGEEKDRKAKEMPKLKMVTKGKRSTVGILESGGCSEGLASNCWCIALLPIGDARPICFVLAIVAVPDDSNRADSDPHLGNGDIL